MPIPLRDAGEGAPQRGVNFFRGWTPGVRVVPRPIVVAQRPPLLVVRAAPTPLEPRRVVVGAPDFAPRVEAPPVETGPAPMTAQQWRPPTVSAPETLASAQPTVAGPRPRPQPWGPRGWATAQAAPLDYDVPTAGLAPGGLWNLPLMHTERPPAPDARPAPPPVAQPVRGSFPGVESVHQSVAATQEQVRGGRPAQSGAARWLDMGEGLMRTIGNVLQMPTDAVTEPYFDQARTYYENRIVARRRAAEATPGRWDDIGAGLATATDVAFGYPSTAWKMLGESEELTQAEIDRLGLRNAVPGQRIPSVTRAFLPAVGGAANKMWNPFLYLMRKDDAALTAAEMGLQRMGQEKGPMLGGDSTGETFAFRLARYAGGALWDYMAGNVAGTAQLYVEAENALARNDPTAREAALQASLNGLSGQRSMWDTYDRLLAKTQTGAMRVRAEAYVASGSQPEMEAAAQLFATADELDGKSWTDIVDEEANPWAEMVWGMVADPTNLLDAPIDLAVDAVRAGRAGLMLARAQRVTPDALRAAWKEGVVEAGLQSVGRAGRARGYSAVDQLPFVGKTTDTMAHTDTSVVWSAAARIFHGVSSVADAKRLIRTWLDEPWKLMEGVEGLESPYMRSVSHMGGKVKFGPLSVANKPLRERTWLLQAARDKLLDMESLARGGKLVPEEFLAEMETILYRAARERYGLKALEELPAGAVAYRVAQQGNGRWAIEYLGKPAKQGGRAPVIATSLLADRKTAESYRKALDKALAAGGRDPLWRAVRALDQVQRAVMSDVWLNLRPGHWIRNAASATATLMADNLYSLRAIGDVLGDLATKVMMAPTPRTFEALHGTRELGAAAEAAGGQTHWSKKVFDSKANVYATANEAASAVWSGFTHVLGNVPFGEQAFYMRAFEKGFSRQFKQVWTFAVNTSLVPQITAAGVDPDTARVIADVVISAGIYGNKVDVARAVRQAVAGMRMPFDPRSLDIPDELITSPGWREITQAVNRYLDDPTDAARAEVQQRIHTILTNDSRRYANLLSEAWTQPGVYEWTEKEIAADGAGLADDLTEAAQAAGVDLDKTGLRNEIVKYQAQVVAVMQETADGVLEALAKGNNPSAVNLAMDYWASLYDLRRIARQRVDETSRMAVAIGTDEAWREKWTATKRIYDELMIAHRDMLRRAQEDANLMAAGREVPRRYDWWNALERYVNYDEERVLEDRAIPLGSTKETPRELWEAVVDGNRQYLDVQYVAVWDALRRFPQADSMDMIRKAQEDIDLFGAHAAAFLAEHRDAAWAGKLAWGEYFKLRNQTWTQMFDNGATVLRNTTRMIVVNGLAQETASKLRWVDEFAGGEFMLVGPSKPDWWWARRTSDGTMHEFKDWRTRPGGGVPVPENVLADMERYVPEELIAEYVKVSSDFERMALEEAERVLRAHGAARRHTPPPAASAPEPPPSAPEPPTVPEAPPSAPPEPPPTPLPSAPEAPPSAPTAPAPAPEVAPVRVGDTFWYSDAAGNRQLVTLIKVTDDANGRNVTLAAADKPRKPIIGASEAAFQRATGRTLAAEKPTLHAGEPFTYRGRRYTLQGVEGDKVTVVHADGKTVSTLPAKRAEVEAATGKAISERTRAELAVPEDVDFYARPADSPPLPKSLIDEEPLLDPGELSVTSGAARRVANDDDLRAGTYLVEPGTDVEVQAGKAVRVQGYQWQAISQGGADKVGWARTEAEAESAARQAAASQEAGLDVYEETVGQVADADWDVLRSGPQRRAIGRYEYEVAPDQGAVTVYDTASGEKIGSLDRAFYVERVPEDAAEQAKFFERMASVVIGQYHKSAPLKGLQSPVKAVGEQVDTKFGRGVVVKVSDRKGRVEYQVKLEATGKTRWVKEATRVEPAPAVAAAAPAPAWGMTKAEWEKQTHDIRFSGPDSHYYRTDGSRMLHPGTHSKKKVVADQHRYEVEWRLIHGESVPAEVLAEYPDLAAKHPALDDAGQRGTVPRYRPVEWRNLAEPEAQPFAAVPGATHRMSYQAENQGPTLYTSVRLLDETGDVFTVEHLEPATHSFKAGDTEQRDDVWSWRAGETRSYDTGTATLSPIPQDAQYRAAGVADLFGNDPGDMTLAEWWAWQYEAGLPVTDENQARAIHRAYLQARYRSGLPVGERALLGYENDEELMRLAGQTGRAADAQRGEAAYTVGQEGETSELLRADAGEPGADVPGAVAADLPAPVRDAGGVGAVGGDGARGGADDIRGAAADEEAGLRAVGGMGSPEGGVDTGGRPAGPGRPRQRAGGRARAGEGERAAPAAPAEPAPAPARSAAPTAANAGRDYSIPDPAELEDFGGPKQRFRSNVDAIRTLKQIQSEGRRATAEEQRILARYSGWGHSSLANSGVFESHQYRIRPDWQAEHDELQALLTPEELASAAGTTPNAHYTTPTVIAAMYKMLDRMGVGKAAHLRVLEPAGGVGTFFGMMPAEWAKRSSRAAVELDKVSGAILEQLYQNAQVQITGFEKAILPRNSFDLIISNVPFGDYGVHDSTFKGTRAWLQKPIHNYYFVKALDLVRPGGMVAFVTSSWTMDAAGRSAFREFLGESADLVAAVRLPGGAQGAFARNAGTEVTTDIIFLRKRMPGEAPGGAAWTRTLELATEEGQRFPVNEYYHAHPDHVLGKHSGKSTMYRSGGYQVEGSGSLAADLDAVIEKLPADVFTPAAGVRPVEKLEVGAKQPLKAGNFAVTKEGVRRWTGTGYEEVKWAVRDGEERARAMMEIRDSARKLLALQREGAQRTIVQAERGNLNKLYDSFRKKWKELNHVTNRRIMRDDPDGYFLQGLEVGFQPDDDDAPAVWSKADIFSRDVIAPPAAARTVTTAKDALMASLADQGRVNTAYMGQLLGREDLDGIEGELGDLVYPNPGGGLETADEYLSGDVLGKLNEARQAAERDPRYARNVAALEAVQPADIEPSRIGARLGSPWIPPDVYEEYFQHLFGGWYSSAKAVKYNKATGQWVLDWPGGVRNSVGNRQTWATSRKEAVELIEEAFNGKLPKVNDSVEYINEAGNRVKGSVLNRDETEAARRKLEEIQENFLTWMWSDPQRGERLHRVYNETHNRWRARRWDGSHLRLEGMSPNISLRQHQKDGIWRILTGTNTLLAHEVGTGKTMTMVGSAMEMRRLGLARKPMIVVPKKNFVDIQNQARALFPGIRILAPTEKEFNEARAVLMSRAATGDWDLIVVSYEQFGKLPVSTPAVDRIVRKLKKEYELALLEAPDASAYGGRQRSDPTRKQIEKALKRLDEQYARMLDRQTDSTINFDELGVDALFVDEAHNFKNLHVPTAMERVPGLGGDGAQRALDLYIKSRLMLETSGGRNLVFATATPVSNSIVEAYVMMKYLMEPVLEQEGYKNFDAWAATFGLITADFEDKPTGYELVQRFGSFQNTVPLNRMMQQVMDIYSTEDLIRSGAPVNIPKMKGGQRTIVATPTNEWIVKGRQELVERWEAIKKMKREERIHNPYVLLYQDINNLAIDLRLYNPAWPDLPDSKVNNVARNVAQIYRETEKERGTQIVFLMRGVPGGSGRYPLYDDLVNKLVAQGVKREEIAYVSQSTTRDAWNRVVNQMNAGKVRVLIGGKTISEGINVQARVAAIHHFDVDWTPASIIQRDGRGLRQGNMWPEVADYVYLQQPVDSPRWKLLEKKERATRQFMSRDLQENALVEVDSITDDEAFAMIAATAEGDELGIEMRQVRSDLDKLGAARRSHFDKRVKAGGQVKLQESVLDAYEARLQGLIADRDAAIRSPEPVLEMRGGGVYGTRAEAAKALAEFIEGIELAVSGEAQMGAFRGFPLSLALRPGQENHLRPYVIVQGANRYDIPVPFREGKVLGGALYNNLVALIDGLPHEAAKLEDEIAGVEHALTEWRTAAQAPFTQEGEIARLTDRAGTLQTQIESRRAVAANAATRVGDAVAFKSASEPGAPPEGSGYFYGEAKEWYGGNAGLFRGEPPANFSTYGNGGLVPRQVDVAMQVEGTRVTPLGAHELPGEVDRMIFATDDGRLTATASVAYARAMAAAKQFHTPGTEVTWHLVTSEMPDGAPALVARVSGDPKPIAIIPRFIIPEGEQKALRYKFMAYNPDAAQFGVILNPMAYEFERKLWESMRRTFKRPRHPTVSDVAAHQIRSLGDAEGRILAALPDLIQKRNTLTPGQRNQIIRAAEALLPQFDDAVTVATHFGQKLADGALLNFKDRRGFDVLLSMLFPYHYFWSRSALNWGKRVMKKPSMVNLYYEQQRAIERENAQANVPARLKGTLPLVTLPDGRQVRIANPLNYALPFAMYFPNTFEDEAENSRVGRWLNNAQQLTPGLLPAWQMALNAWLDYASPLPDGERRLARYLSVGNYVPQYRTAGYLTQAMTGRNLPGAGDAWDTYRAGRAAAELATPTAGTAAAISPTDAQYAQQIALNLAQGRPRYSGLPYGVERRAEAAYKAAQQRAGGQRATTLATGFATGVPAYVYPPQEQRARGAQAAYGALGYSERNPQGSKAAQRGYLDANPWLPAWWSKGELAVGAQAGQQTPAESARYAQQSAELDKVYREWAQAKERFLFAHPNAGAQELAAVNEPFFGQIESIKRRFGVDPRGASTNGMNPSEEAIFHLEEMLRFEPPNKPAYPRDGASDADRQAYYTALGAWKRARLDTIEQLLYGTLRSPDMRRYPWVQEFRRLVTGEYASELVRKYDDLKFAGPVERAWSDRTSLEAERRAAEFPAHVQEVAQRLGRGVARMFEEYHGLPAEQRRVYKETHPAVRAALVAGYSPAEYDALLAAFGQEAWSVYFAPDYPAYPGDGASEAEQQAYYTALARFNAAHPTSAAIRLWVNGRYKWPGEASTVAPGSYYDFGQDFQQAARLFGADIWQIEANYPRNGGGKEKGKYLDRYPQLPAYWEWKDEFGEEPEHAGQLPRLNWLAQRQASPPASFAPAPYSGERPVGSGRLPIGSNGWSPTSPLQTPAGVAPSVPPGADSSKPIPPVSPTYPPAMGATADPNSPLAGQPPTALASGGPEAIYAGPAPDFPTQAAEVPAFEAGNIPPVDPNGAAVQWGDPGATWQEYAARAQANDPQQQQWLAGQQRVASVLGQESAALAAAYYDLEAGSPERAALRAQHPEMRLVNLLMFEPGQYATLAELFGEDALRAWGDMPASDGSEQARAVRSAYYDEQPAAFLINAWLYGRASGDGAEPTSADEQSFYNGGEDYAEAQARFGGGIWQVVAGYRRGWSKDEKRAYYDAHPELSDFFDWWYAGLPDGGSRAGSGNLVTARGGWGGWGGSGGNYERPQYFDAPRVYPLELSRGLGQVTSGLGRSWTPTTGSGWTYAGQTLRPETARRWQAPRYVPRYRVR